MDNENKMHNQKDTVIAANAPTHYNVIVIGIVVGLIGIFLRFAGESAIISWVSNILFVLGSVISIKGVLSILK